MIINKLGKTSITWGACPPPPSTRLQICEPQTYEMRVVTFYSDSATAVSPTGRTLIGAKGPENVWLSEPSRLLKTVNFL